MKKICFIPPLLKITLTGLKNQTRRIAKTPVDREVILFDLACKSLPTIEALGYTKDDETKEFTFIKPHYKVGEIVAIAQPYKDILDTLPEPYRRKSDGWINTEISESIGFRNKLYVKPSLMPHQIKITGVRAERLQDISNEDCIKEGIFQHISHAKVYWKNGFDNLMYESPRDAYTALINKIHSKDTWVSNPYVWVYDYELIK